MYTWRAFNSKHIKLLILIPIKVRNWVRYYVDLLGMTPRKMFCFDLRNGMLFLGKANSTDRAIMTTVAVQDEYCLRPMVKEVGRLGTVIDIGAQIGIFSVVAAANANTVYAFEPHPGNFQLLTINKHINGAENIRCEQIAVVAKPQKNVTLFEDADNTGGHSLLPIKRAKKYAVATKTLKEIVDEVKSVDLLKIDIEGAEHPLLLDTPRAVFKNIKRIHLECANIDSKRNNQIMQQYLERLGYHVRRDGIILFAER
jgi:FkbM family methyltransferase